jgi:hypothetical protein
MKAYGGMDIWIHIFLTWAQAEDEWSVQAPTALPPGTHYIGGWVDPRTGLDDVEKILDPYEARTVTPRSSGP